MTNGLILLGLLAVLFALVTGRLRRRIGLPVTGRIMAMTISGFAIVVLVLWVASSK
jgi:hypothetical protein